MNLLRHLPLSPNVRPLHAITYLLAVPLFSISFLVFLNASLSFLLTNLFLVPPSQLGSVVGTLGFVDELVAIVAAPTWGVLSDGRLGTRGVAVAGYLAISASLLSFVSLQSVYPGLVLGRMLFAAGAAAVTTMVSAILPEMTNAPPPTLGEEPIETVLAAAVISPPAGKLAGVVGVLSGVGALLALGVFLPLPSRFAGREGVTPAEAVRWAYWVVAGVAAGVAAWCAVGLAPPRNPGGGVVSGIKEWMWTKIWGGDRVFVSGSETRGKRNGGGGWGLVEAAKLAVTDEKIAVAYVGGFVARASSVGISLFIPLFVNHYFITTGRCSPSGTDLPSKDACKKAYVLASSMDNPPSLCPPY